MFVQFLLLKIDQLLESMYLNVGLQVCYGKLMKELENYFESKQVKQERKKKEKKERKKQ